MLSSLTNRFVQQRTGRVCQVIDLARYRYRIGDLRADLEQGCITTAEYQRAREALRDELLNAEQVDGRKSGGLRERLMPLLFVLSVVGVAYLFYNWLDHPMSSAGFAVSNSSDIGVVASKDYRL
jgi:cytochrome c-type biogenesis protein CcmI